MQNNVNEEEKQETMTVAEELLSEGLKKFAKESIKSDAKSIADILEMDVRTIRPYLKGSVAEFNTGTLILKELRKLIDGRVESVEKLVA